MKNSFLFYFLIFCNCTRIPSYFLNLFFDLSVIVVFLFLQMFIHDSANAYAITRTIWRRRSEMSAKETKRKRSRESLPMNHSRRYRTIWTSSPACSEHVYLRFRVSTLRHCTRFPSLSLSLPFSLHRRCIDIAEVRRRCPKR